jgi:predicted Zn-dependent protease
MTMVSGKGIFFDGNTTARQDVTVELATAELIIRDAGGGELARWPYAELDQAVAPEQVLRLGCGRQSLARLEIRDPALAAAIDEKSTPVDRTWTVQRHLSLKIAVLVVLAVVSLAVMALFALPALASRLTPYLPYSLEMRLGQATDAQLRSTFSGARGLPLDCGTAEAEKPGAAALAALGERLGSAAALPVPLRFSVIRRNDANAVALPGGQIYVFAGLIAKANTPDELAGVIAHEIGHVARRDGVRSVLETAGLSFLFGMVLGDFVGGGAIVIAAKTVLQSSYSRDTETAADAYGIALMNKAGGNAEALGALLTRIDDLHSESPELLRDHPATQERVAAIRAQARPQEGAPLLTPDQWAALKNICVGR